MLYIEYKNVHNIVNPIYNNSKLEFYRKKYEK